MRDKLPRVVRVDGIDHWYIGEKDFGVLGSNVIVNDNNKLLSRLSY
jgi:hypothetical protein